MLMTFDDVETLAGELRAKVSFARDNARPVDDFVAFVLAVADLLEVPDELPVFPAVGAALDVPTRLDDPASLAQTKVIAHAAGRRALASASR
jgi:hypothetical protein